MRQELTLSTPFCMFLCAQSAHRAMPAGAVRSAGPEPSPLAATGWLPSPPSASAAPQTPPHPLAPWLLPMRRRVQVGGPALNWQGSQSGQFSHANRNAHEAKMIVPPHWRVLLNRNAHSAQPRTPTQAVCAPGFGAAADNSMCTICARGSWSPGGSSTNPRPACANW